MEEPGGLHSMGSLRVGCDSANSLSLSHNGEGNGNPFQCSCLENPRVGRAWWAAIYGVAQSRTRLKRLSSSTHVFQVAFFLETPQVTFYFPSISLPTRALQISKWLSNDQDLCDIITVEILDPLSGVTNLFLIICCNTLYLWES